MDLSFLLTTNTLLLFLLLLTRISGMLVAAPFFSTMNIPMQVKIGIAVAIALVLFPIYSLKAHLPATDLWSFSWSVGQELAIGLIIGFAASLLFTAVQMAGSHVTMQMGLGMAQAVDPIYQEQSPVVGQLYFVLAITLFLSLNIHHSLIIAVGKSFDAVPLAAGFQGMGLLTGRMMAMASNLFTLSVMLILPILGIMLVKEIAMAFMAKIMPQMNIFMVSLPLKIALGLLLISMTLPFTAELLGKAYEELVRHLLVLYQL